VSAAASSVVASSVSAAASSVVVGLLGLLGLGDSAQVVDGEASFPLGLLYPYTKALRRVCSSYDALCRDYPDTQSVLAGTAGPAAEPGPERGQARASAVAGFLASVASLHNQIAFAPG
jgi:hypothetical protein